jgi:hypothetical protein
MENDKESYMDKLKSRDIVSLMRTLIDRGSYSIDAEKDRLVPVQRTPYNTPWHHINSLEDADCEKWHRILFQLIQKQMGVAWPPSRCQNCWKIVVRPGTLKQLFELEALQIEMDEASKCGIELRETVHGLYGGYFYTHSLKEGMERYHQVRINVDANLSNGKEVPVILKRGCTEFELACGDSRLWKTTPDQAEVELLLETYLLDFEKLQPQPPLVVSFVHRRWIEFAYSMGDDTYKLYTNGKSLYPTLITYHHLLNASKEEIQKFFDEAKEGEPRELLMPKESSGEEVNQGG